MDCLSYLAQEIAAGRPAVLMTVVAAPSNLLGHKLLVGPGGVLAASAPLPELANRGLELAMAALAQRARPATHTLELAAGEVRVYVEPYLPPPRLVIAGAGHLAAALSGIAQAAGFSVIIIDDRPAYATSERFPAADQVICAPFVEALGQLDLGAHDYVALVTRGHRYDMVCLAAVLHRPVAYIGMIGSRRRIDTVFELLQAEVGIDPALFGRVYAPIGLDIGAHTPAEIAVSIVAELVRHRRGGTGEHLCRLARARIHDARPAAQGCRSAIGGKSGV